jgi:hypothetical protein
MSNQNLMALLFRVLKSTYQITVNQSAEIYALKQMLFEFGDDRVRDAFERHQAAFYLMPENSQVPQVLAELERSLQTISR